MFGLFVILIVAGSSLWVLADASRIGAKPGLFKGISDMGPGSWFLCCLLVWVIGFPAYLATRQRIIDAVANQAGRFGSAMPKAGQWRDPVAEWDMKQRMAKGDSASPQLQPKPTATVTIATLDCPLCARAIPAAGVRIGSNTCPECRGAFEAQAG